MSDPASQLTVAWLHLLIFPALIGIALLSLRYFAYQNLKNVNEVFVEGYRSPKLRSTLTTIMFLTVTAFVAVQIVRFPFLVSVATDLIHWTGQRAWLQTGAAVFFAGLVVFETLALCHLLYYLYLCRCGADRERTLPQFETVGVRPDLSGVAILIPARDEPLDVLDRSFGSIEQLRYPGIRCFLVENSRNPENKRRALEFAASHGVEAFDLANRGTKAAALNDARTLLDDAIRYVVVLDADQRIVDDAMLSELLPLLEEDSDVAFVQTAQAYSNCEDSLVTFAAAQQQMLVYDCLMEGKADRGSAPCFGTNFVMRLDALDAIGGWDEDNVTEDISTSYRLQAQGWKSLFIRKIYAMGVALPSLGSYWTQQRRWASGNTSLALSLIGRTLTAKRPFSLGLDYLFSAGFYLQLFVLSGLSLAPAVALILATLYAPEMLRHAPELLAPAWAFSSFYVLYVIVLFFPHINMAMRGYPIRNSILVHGLTTVTAPVCMSGVREALFRRAPIEFARSQRAPSQAAAAPLYRAPQTWIFSLVIVTGSYFTALALSVPTNPIPWILSFWAFVHGLSLGHFFLFRSSGAPQSARLQGS